MYDQAQRTLTNVELWDGRNVWCHGRIDGLPAFKWGQAPAGLATLAQLHAATPKLQRRRGQDPYAVLFWWSRRFGRRTANLYRVDQAVPAQPMTPRRHEALFKAYLAHFICRSCGQEQAEYLPTTTWMCPACAKAAGTWEIAA
ncbi:RRQRL motif-containing zinc-binding protein [Saccharopolyspora shandongensis]|uniref:RRQRL motif-containing zinc-binding protein n=1 Tax=Saccharopolyspora shandongensis TaxID=418495 RepID=UPI0033F219C5